MNLQELLSIVGVAIALATFVRIQIEAGQRSTRQLEIIERIDKLRIEIAERYVERAVDEAQKARLQDRVERLEMRAAHP